MVQHHCWYTGVVALLHVLRKGAVVQQPTTVSVLLVWVCNNPTSQSVLGTVRVSCCGGTEMHPSCCQLKIVPQLCILSQLASVEAKCNVSERHVKASQTKPRFTPNQIEDLTGRIRFSAMRVPGHASDNKHTDTNARCSLVFSLNFQTLCLPLCKFANLEITGWFRATWACLKEPEWGFFPPLFTCFPLLTVEQIPTDTISYFKK